MRNFEAERSENKNKTIKTNLIFILFLVGILLYFGGKYCQTHLLCQQKPKKRTKEQSDIEFSGVKLDTREKNPG